jgi:putative radical SAM enzyme (TIGR03279 family)
MRPRRHRIKEVESGSIADEAGIEPGDMLLAVNRTPVNDILEYRYLIGDEHIELLVQKPSGHKWLLDIEKDSYEDLGIVFERQIMDKARSCRNKCIFCFIDQLPAGMRKSLYFKDDDSRLSLLHGNFITMTNLTASDVERIIKYRISPLNISVHTTNPELRSKMLGNPKGGTSLKLLKMFAEGGIILNCQIVLCPDINDGPELDKTLSDLGRLWPSVNSIGVVPVGLTRFREGLYGLKRYGADASTCVITQVDKWQKRFLNGYGSRIVFAADEFYIKAGLPVPEAQEYDGFPQIENGIGLMALFKEQFETELGTTDRKCPDSTVVSVATGRAAYEFICDICRRIMMVCPSVRIMVYPIDNRFFGDSIDVAGLVTGRDLIEQLSGKELGKRLIIPEVMLKSGEDIFLDGLSVEDVSRALGTGLTVCAVKGDRFLAEILREEIS